MTKPIVSKDFNLEDIRKIREYNSLRHVQMTPGEIGFSKAAQELGVNTDTLYGWNRRAKEI